jgi:hypothetical protein
VLSQGHRGYQPISCLLTSTLAGVAAERLPEAGAAWPPLVASATVPGCVQLLGSVLYVRASSAADDLPDVQADFHASLAAEVAAELAAPLARLAEELSQPDLAFSVSAAAASGAGAGGGGGALGGVQLVACHPPCFEQQAAGPLLVMLRCSGLGVPEQPAQGGEPPLPAAHGDAAGEPPPPPPPPPVVQGGGRLVVFGAAGSVLLDQLVAPLPAGDSCLTLSLPPMPPGVVHVAYLADGVPRPAFVQPLPVLPPPAAADLLQRWAGVLTQRAADDSAMELHVDLARAQLQDLRGDEIGACWKRQMAPLLVDLAYLLSARGAGGSSGGGSGGVEAQQADAAVAEAVLQHLAESGMWALAQHVIAAAAAQQQQQQPRGLVQGLGLGLQAWWQGVAQACLRVARRLAASLQQAAAALAAALRHGWVLASAALAALPGVSGSPTPAAVLAGASGAAAVAAAAPSAAAAAAAVPATAAAAGPAATAAPVAAAAADAVGAAPAAAAAVDAAASAVPAVAHVAAGCLASTCLLSSCDGGSSNSSSSSSTSGSSSKASTASASCNSMTNFDCISCRAAAAEALAAPAQPLLRRRSLDLLVHGFAPPETEACYQQFAARMMRPGDILMSGIYIAMAAVIVWPMRHDADPLLLPRAALSLLSCAAPGIAVLLYGGRQGGRWRVPIFRAWGCLVFLSFTCVVASNDLMPPIFQRCFSGHANLADHLTYVIKYGAMDGLRQVGWGFAIALHAVHVAVYSAFCLQRGMAPAVVALRHLASTVMLVAVAGVSELALRRMFVKWLRGSNKPQQQCPACAS